MSYITKRPSIKWGDFWYKLHQLDQVPCLATGVNTTTNVLKNNPYLSTISSINYYKREKAASIGSLGMSHNFCESPLIKWQNVPNVYDDFKPGGELYELVTQIATGSGRYCNLDINIVSGAGEDVAASGTNNVSEGTYQPYRTNTLYTTFGNMRKWNTYFQSGGIRETHNLFVMPQMQSVTSGFYIQVGPGNSDNDFNIDGQSLSGGNAVGSGSNPNWRVLNSYYSDGDFRGSTTLTQCLLL